MSDLQKQLLEGIGRSSEQEECSDSPDDSPDDEHTLLTRRNSSYCTGDESITDATSATYDLDAKRWWILASYCAMNVSNGWICALWTPLTSRVAEYWETTPGAVDSLGGIYMFVFVPTNFFAMWLVVNHLGLARGLHIGALLNFIGSSVIYGSSFLSSILSPNFLTEYRIVYLGTFFSGLGQAFLLPMIALLSSSWFGEEERATATSFGSLAFQLGTLIGCGSTVVINFVNDQGQLEGHTLNTYLQSQWFLALASFIMVVVNIREDRPATPPSTASAALEEGATLHYGDSIRLVLGNSASRTFFCVFGLAVGSFYAAPIFLSQSVPDWPLRSQGLLGGIVQIATVFGCLAAGRLVPWFRWQYKKIAKLLLGGCLVSTSAFLILVYRQSYLAIAAGGGMGFCFSCFMSVGIEFGTALTFPADEAAVYGLLDATAELTGFLLVALGASMSHDILVFWGVLVCLVAVAFLCVLEMKESIRRPSTWSSIEDSATN